MNDAVSKAVPAGSVEEPVPAAATVRPRLDSIDLVRGAVMVLMALDHVRDFFSNARYDPLDLTQTSLTLYVTRWVTHFCAPVFVFLAGTGAYLSGTRGKTKGELSRFLFFRGLWLIILEFSIVHFGWTFDLDPHFEVGQVIWVIGLSLVILSGLIHLSVEIVAAFGLLMIGLHNLLDPIRASSLGGWSRLFSVLHVQGPIQPLPGYTFLVMYPVIPWVGVMAAGYAFGTLYTWDGPRRRRALLALGSSALALFAVLRFFNVYGDPHPWSPQSRGALYSVLSFFKVEKYPPSLLYLLVTLGPALLALAWLERPARGLGRALVTFGRVPLFYYVIHLPLIHLLSGVYAVGKYGRVAFTFNPLNLPEDFGCSLPVVYAIWLGVVLILYRPCRWFADLKRRRKDEWLSYF